MYFTLNYALDKGIIVFLKITKYANIKKRSYLKMRLVKLISLGEFFHLFLEK